MSIFKKKEKPEKVITVIVRDEATGDIKDEYEISKEEVKEVKVEEKIIDVKLDDMKKKQHQYDMGFMKDIQDMFPEEGEESLYKIIMDACGNYKTKMLGDQKSEMLKDEKIKSEKKETDEKQKNLIDGLFGGAYKKAEKNEKTLKDSVKEEFFSTERQDEINKAAEKQYCK
jgi:hypothetical protein